MAIGWMRLDLGFWHDQKFVALIADKGEAAAFKAVKLYCLAAERYGVLDLRDKAVRLWIEGEIGLKGKRLDDFMGACIDAGIFSREHFDAMGVYTSRRLSAEGEKRRTTEERRSIAGKKSGEARANKR